MYDKHIKKVNAYYKRKLVKAKAILTSKNLTGLSFYVPKQGLFLWLTLPAEVSLSRIKEKLDQHNILIGTSSQFYINDGVEKNLRLCISGVPEEDITALGAVIDVNYDIGYDNVLFKANILTLIYRFLVNLSIPM